MKMNLTRPYAKVQCPDCDGYGDIEGQLQGRELMVCPRCEGRGWIYDTGDEPVPSDGFKQPLEKAGREND